MVCLSSCGEPAPTTVGAPTTRIAPALVATTPAGFTGETGNVNAGGVTGSIGIGEATYIGCDGVGVKNLQEDHWVATERRFFDQNPAYPRLFLLMCVTELGSPSDASQDQEQKLGFLSGGPTTSFSVPQIPGATGLYLGDIPEIIFTKGKYFVFVEGAGVSTASKATRQSLVTNLAHTQYQLLPV